MTRDNPALDRARKRAKELRGFYSHLLTYVLVSTLLVFIDLADSSVTATEFLGLSWAYWPILGWGVAVVIHAINTFFGFNTWEERKTEELYEQEKQKELMGR